MVVWLGQEAENAISFWPSWLLRESPDNEVGLQTPRSIVIGEEDGPIKYLSGWAHFAAAAVDRLHLVKPGLQRGGR